MIVMYIDLKDELYYLLLKNRNHGTWGFLSCTGEKDESYSTTASRELKEETKRILTNKTFQTSFFHTPSNKYFPKKVRYKVYFIKLSGTKNDMKHLENQFSKTTPLSYHEDENTRIKFVKETNLNRYYLWNYIKEELIHNEVFKLKLKESIKNDLKLSISH